MLALELNCGAVNAFNLVVFDPSSYCRDSRKQAPANTVYRNTWKDRVVRELERKFYIREH
jgi:hypothetical protein